MYDKHKMKRNEIRADSFFLFIRKVYADDKLRLSFVHRRQNSVAGSNSSTKHARYSRYSGGGQKYESSILIFRDDTNCNLYIYKI